MRRVRLSIVLAVGSVLANLGCGSHPIPRVAVAGTTITIPMPSWFNPGFGGVLNEEIKNSPGNRLGASVVVPYADPYGPGSELEDEQRGEMLFALHNTNDPDSGFESYLPLRQIIRVHLDEGSRAATPAPGETVTVIGTDYRDGQVLALVDIPADVTGPTEYWIFPERWKRQETSPYSFVQDQPMTEDGLVAWRGWGTSDPQGGIPITIVPAPAGDRFNPLAGWDNWFGDYASANVSDDLDNLVPRPKVKLWVIDLGTNEIPAAWELEVEYPREKAEILGVELGRHHKSGGFVTWQPDDGQLADCGQSPPRGSFRIVMVDPDQKTSSVSVIYRLRDFASCGRVGPGEFAIAAGSLKAYDQDGVPFGAYPWIDDAWSFH